MQQSNFAAKVKNLDKGKKQLKRAFLDNNFKSRLFPITFYQ